MSNPELALERLAAHLREEPVISPHVRDSVVAPLLGELVASGPRVAAAPEDYAFLVESIREGYLLHYAEPRLLDVADPDLNLLAGDYLYALGLERLAIRGDLDAVRELADLISLAAQLHARPDADGAALAEALWMASAVAVGAGGDPEHELAKERLRDGGPVSTAEELLASATRRAEEAGMRDALAVAAEQVGFATRS
jgi:hypothetical protein